MLDSPDNDARLWRVVLKMCRLLLSICAVSQVWGGKMTAWGGGGGRGGEEKSKEEAEQKRRRVGVREGEGGGEAYLATWTVLHQWDCPLPTHLSALSLASVWATAQRLSHSRGRSGGNMVTVTFQQIKLLLRVKTSAHKQINKKKRDFRNEANVYILQFSAKPEETLNKKPIIHRHRHRELLWCHVQLTCPLIFHHVHQLLLNFLSGPQR